MAQIEFRVIYGQYSIDVSSNTPRNFLDFAVGEIE